MPPYIFFTALSPPLSLFFFFFFWFVKVVWMTRKQNLFWTAICMAAKWRVVCVLDFSFLFSLIEEFIILVNLIAILRNYLLFFLFWGSLVGIGCVFGCAFFWSLLGMGWDEFIKETQSCPHNNHPLFNLNIISTILNFLFLFFLFFYKYNLTSLKVAYDIGQSIFTMENN